MSVLVFGSINLDLSVYAKEIPKPGQTILGSNLCVCPGGKGANQAVALSNLKIPTKMFGCVGKDVFAEQSLFYLKKSKTDISNVNKVAGNSGLALITINARAENAITVASGANAKVGIKELAAFKSSLKAAKLVLMQLELNFEIIEKAVDAANLANVPVILDPAPVCNLSDEFLKKICVITPNVSEAEFLTGIKITEVKHAEKAGKILLERGAKIAIIKCGEKGSVCVTPKRVIITPAIKVKAVDTVAAGDAFNAGFAAAQYCGMNLEDSLEYATAVAALAVMQKGAQAAMPTLRALKSFLK